MKITQDSYDTIIALDSEDFEAIRRTADILKSIRNSWEGRSYLYADSASWKHNEIADTEKVINEIADYLEVENIRTLTIAY